MCVCIHQNKSNISNNTISGRQGGGCMPSDMFVCCVSSVVVIFASGVLRCSFYSANIFAYCNLCAMLFVLFLETSSTGILFPFHRGEQGCRISDHPQVHTGPPQVACSPCYWGFGALTCRLLRCAPLTCRLLRCAPPSHRSIHMLVLGLRAVC